MILGAGSAGVRFAVEFSISVRWTVEDALPGGISTRAISLKSFFVRSFWRNGAGTGSGSI